MIVLLKWQKSDIGQNLQCLHHISSFQEMSENLNAKIWACLTLTEGLKESSLSNTMNIMHLNIWTFLPFELFELYELYELYEPHRRERRATPWIYFPFEHFDIPTLWTSWTFSGELKGKLLELQLDWQPDRFKVGS